jgi:hypothetical protein
MTLTKDGLILKLAAAAEWKAVPNLGLSSAWMDGGLMSVPLPAHAFVEAASRDVVGVDEKLRRAKSSGSEFVSHPSQQHPADSASPVVRIDSDIANLGHSRGGRRLCRCETENLAPVGGHDEYRSLLLEAVEQDAFGRLQRRDLSLAISFRCSSRPDLGRTIDIPRVAETDL